MEEQKTLSPETQKKIIRVATFELIIELVLIVLLLFVLQWPADFRTIGIFILATMLFGVIVMDLILHDKKESPA